MGKEFNENMKGKGKSNIKGSKAIADYGIKLINEECKTCSYYLIKRNCEGRYNPFTPCIFAQSDKYKKGTVI
jgi:hypothetical protein